MSCRVTCVYKVLKVKEVERGKESRSDKSE